MKYPCADIRIVNSRLPAFTRLLVFTLCALHFSCTFERDNPLDPENESYVEVNITSHSDGVIIGKDSITIVWEGIGKLDEYHYCMDNGPVIDECLSDTACFGFLDEGLHTFYVTMINLNGNIAADTLAFYVDVIKGPSMVLYPQKLTCAGNTSFQIKVMLEEVSKIIGANVFLVFDHSKIAFEQAVSPWSFFQAEIISQDTIELSISSFDTTDGYTGSGELASLHFKTGILTTPTDIQFIPQKTRMINNAGHDVDISILRNGRIEK